MPYATFHNRVRITTGGVNYDLPVDSAKIKAIPYSGNGQTAVDLFDGRRVQRIDGYRYEVELNWRELKTTDHVILYNVVTALFTNGSGVIDCDPPNGKTITVIIGDAGEAIQAVFNGMVRNRPASLRLVSSSVDATMKNWIHT
jgi:hypothetical protein